MCKNPHVAIWDFDRTARKLCSYIEVRVPRRGPEKVGDRGTGMLMGAGPGRQDESDCE